MDDWVSKEQYDELWRGLNIAYQDGNMDMWNIMAKQCSNRFGYENNHCRELTKIGIGLEPCDYKFCPLLKEK